MPSLQEKLGEIELILASTSEDEFQWKGTAHEVTEWKHSVSFGNVDESTELPPLSYSLKLSAEDAKGEIWLNVDYPRGGGGEASLVIQAPHLSKIKLEQLHGVMEERQSHAIDEDFGSVVFDVYTALKDHITSDAETERSNTPETSVKAEENQLALQHEVEMSRVIFWSHHLKAPSKKRDMSAWCSELSLWGLVKSGFPAYLCFEGQRDDVQVIVKRIKALQWHAITVRTEEPYVYQASVRCSSMQEAREEALQHCLLAKGHSAENTSRYSGKLRTTMDEVESGKELVARLKLADVPEAEYRSAMNL